MIYGMWYTINDILYIMYDICAVLKNIKQLKRNHKLKTGTLLQLSKLSYWNFKELEVCFYSMIKKNPAPPPPPPPTPFHNLKQVYN